MCLTHSGFPGDYLENLWQPVGDETLDTTEKNCATLCPASLAFLLASRIVEDRIVAYLFDDLEMKLELRVSDPDVLHADWAVRRYAQVLMHPESQVDDLNRG